MQRRSNFSRSTRSAFLQTACYLETLRANDRRAHLVFSRTDSPTVERRRQARRWRGRRRRRRKRRRGRKGRRFRKKIVRFRDATVSRKHSSRTELSRAVEPRSLAVTPQADSQWSCPQATDEQFWHVHGLARERVLSVNLSPSKRLRTHYALLPFIRFSLFSRHWRPGAMLFGSLEQPIIQSDTITRGCFITLAVTRFYFLPILIGEFNPTRHEFHRFNDFTSWYAPGETLMDLLYTTYMYLLCVYPSALFATSRATGYSLLFTLYSSRRSMMVLAAG